MVMVMVMCPLCRRGRCRLRLPKGIFKKKKKLSSLDLPADPPSPDARTALRDACRPSTSQYIREHYNKSCPVVRKSLSQKAFDVVEAVVEHALEVRTRNDRAMRHLKHVGKKIS